MKNYYVPLILTVGGNLFYHLSQKMVPKEANPLYTMMVVYSIAIIACAACALFYPGEKTLWQTARESNWTIFAMGLSIAMIEVGFLITYRVGWNISTAAVIVSVSVTLMLIPIGVLAFKEQLSARNVVGLLMCLLGLILVAKR